MQDVNHDTCNARSWTWQNIFKLLRSVDETLVCDHPNVKAIKQYFHVILIIIAVQVKYMDETLVCSAI